MSRAVLRFVAHRIRRHPECEAAASARCLHGECGWEVAASADVRAVEDACMAHTGRHSAHTGRHSAHTTFARVFTDVALVERVM